MIIEFYYEGDEFLLDISKDGSDEVNIDEIQKLLDKYRKEDEYYDNYGWAEYLEENGYTVKYIEPEERIYF